MRIVEGRGNSRKVTELPGLSVRTREPKQHQALIENMIERICPRDAAYQNLSKRGVRVYS